MEGCVDDTVELRPVSGRTGESSGSQPSCCANVGSPSGGEMAPSALCTELGEADCPSSLVSLLRLRPSQRHAWGWSVELDRDAYTRTVLCYGERGRSSLHYHERLDNEFRVLTGALEVRLDGEPCYLEHDRGFCAARSRQKHRLRILLPGFFVERYHRINQDHPWDDIVRLEPGASE